MDKHRASKKESRLRKIFGMAGVGAAGTAVAASALLSGLGHGVASADTGSISVFGQGMSSVSPSADPEWRLMQNTQAAALRIPFNRQAYNNYMAQFDQCQGGSLAQKVACVNSIVNTGPDRIRPSKWNLGFQAPVETIVTHTGDSKSVVALEADILVNKLGVNPKQVLVTDVLDHGCSPYNVLLVTQAPGAPAPNSIAMSNFPTIAQANNGDVGQKWIVAHGSTANLSPVEARTADGKAVWKANSGPGMS